MRAMLLKLSEWTPLRRMAKKWARTPATRATVERVREMLESVESSPPAAPLPEPDKTCTLSEREEAAFFAGRTCETVSFVGPRLAPLGTPQPMEGDERVQRTIAAYAMELKRVRAHAWLSRSAK